MWESIEPTWGVFATFVLFFPPQRPLCFVRPLAPQNCAKGGDSAHSENHCTTGFENEFRNAIQCDKKKTLYIVTARVLNKDAPTSLELQHLCMADLWVSLCFFFNSVLILAVLIYYYNYFSDAK